MPPTANIWLSFYSLQCNLGSVSQFCKGANPENNHHCCLEAASKDRSNADNTSKFKKVFDRIQHFPADHTIFNQVSFTQEARY